jgi:hypothetical protein
MHGGKGNFPPLTCRRELCPGGEALFSGGKMKAILWIVAIIFIIGLLVVMGLLDLIF